MNPIRFPGAQIAGKPLDWDDKRDGECVGLPVAISVITETGMKMFTSIWKPTAEERRCIAEGENIAITCFGVQVPIALTPEPIDGPIVPFSNDEAPSQ